jgi:WD40 repeat protein
MNMISRFIEAESDILDDFLENDMRFYTNPMCLRSFLLLTFSILVGCGNDPSESKISFQQVGHVQSLAFSPDGKYFAAGSRDFGENLAKFWEGRVIVWEIATGKQVASLDQPRWANTLSFSPDGKLLAVGIGSVNLQFQGSGEDTIGFVKRPGEVRVYEVATWKQVIQMHDVDMVEIVKFSPDGKALASSGSFGPPYPPGTVTLYNIASGKETFKVPGIQSHQPAIAFDLKNGDLVVADIGKFKIFDPKSRKMVREISTEWKNNPLSFDILPNGKMLFGGGVAVRDFQTGNDLTPVYSTKEFTRMAPTTASSADGRFFAGMEMPSSPVRNDPWIRIWDRQTQKIHAQWNWGSKAGWLSAIAFSADGTNLAVGSNFGQIKVFSVPK